MNIQAGAEATLVYAPDKTLATIQASESACTIDSQGGMFITGVGRIDVDAFSHTGQLKADQWCSWHRGILRLPPSYLLCDSERTVYGLDSVKFARQKGAALVEWSRTQGPIVQRIPADLPLDQVLVWEACLLYPNEGFTVEDTHGIYADWCEEHGWHERAEQLRAWPNIIMKPGFIVKVTREQMMGIDPPTSARQLAYEAGRRIGEAQERQMIEAIFRDEVTP